MNFPRYRIKLPLKRRAAFGVDAAIMIGFILAMMIALATFGPSILSLFTSALMGGANGAYALLIELPTWDPSKPPTAPPEGASPAMWVGYAAHRMYGVLQPIALGLLSIVLIMAALCYLMESFRIMSEGTAINIIMNSAFALILVFAAPYIYNGVAAAINVFTGWPDIGGTGLIIEGAHELDEIINAMGGGVLAENLNIFSADFWTQAVVRFFGSVVIFIIATSLVILATLMGVVRLLVIGCMAAALPLLIMLRLIPPVKRLADSLIEVVIGIMFASIIAAILIHFSYLLIAETDLGGLTKLAIALASFAGIAYMSTMFAGRLGGLFVTMGGMASQASSMATGLMLGGVAMGAGSVAGGIAGVRQAAALNLLSGPNWQNKLWPGAKTFFKGALTGLGVAATQVLPSMITGKGPGRVMQYAASAVPSAVHSAQDVARGKAGAAMDALLHKWASSALPGESVGLGMQWYRENIENAPPAAVGELFEQKTGLKFRDPAEVGARIQKFLQGAVDTPIPYRVSRKLEEFAGMPKEVKGTIIAEALDSHEEYRKNVEKMLGNRYFAPNLEDQDVGPGYWARILETPTLGKYGKAVKARTLALMTGNYGERLRGAEPGVTLSADEGVNWAKQLIYGEDGKRSDMEVGAIVAKELSVDVPKERLGELGHQYKDMIEKLMEYEEGGKLLHNFMLNWQRAREGGLQRTDLRSALEHLESNEAKVASLIMGSEKRSQAPKAPLRQPEISLGSFFQGLSPSTQQASQQQADQQARLRGRMFDLSNPQDRSDLEKMF